MKEKWKVEKRRVDKIEVEEIVGETEGVGEMVGKIIYYINILVNASVTLCGYLCKLVKGRGEGKQSIKNKYKFIYFLF